MTGLEIVALVSLIINGWQFYDRGGLQEENQIYEDMAKQCQESKGNNRVTELRSADERTKQESVIQGITLKSKQHTRELNQVGRDTCGGALYPGGSGIVEESIKRSKAINDQWVRGSGLSDD